MRCAVLAVALVGGCGRIDFDLLADASAGIDACTFGAWTTPQPVTEVSSASNDYAPALDEHALTMVVQSNRAGSIDLWISTRATIMDPFSTPQNLTAVNSTSDDKSPALSADGLTLYFSSGRTGPLRLYRATRSSTADLFGPATAVGELGAVTIGGSSISSDGSELFYSNDTNPVDLYRATFAAGVFTVAGALDELNTSIDQGYPSVSGDGRDLYFETTRSDGVNTDIWIATRSGPGQPFANIREVTELSIAGFFDDDPEISRDGRTIVFASGRPGGLGGADVWMSTRACQ